MASITICSSSPRYSPRPIRLRISTKQKLLSRGGYATAAGLVPSGGTNGVGGVELVEDRALTEEAARQLAIQARDPMPGAVRARAGRLLERGQRQPPCVHQIFRAMLLMHGEGLDGDLPEGAERPVPP